MQPTESGLPYPYVEVNLHTMNNEWIEASLGLCVSSISALLYSDP